MKILVAGGGAAGMMAAIFAARAGAQVTLLEANEKLGKKLFITGKGRCNLTNDAEREAFFGAIYRNPRFFYSAFSRFDNQRVKAFFQEAGLALKSERGGRVFPVSDKSSDVIRALEKCLQAAGVKIELKTRVTELTLKKGRLTGVKARGPRGELSFPADRVILALGGLSYPSTGSTGDGYRLAEQAGHHTEATYPSLVPINAAFCDEAKAFTPADLMGLSLKNVRLTMKLGKKPLFNQQGELLFTHFGLSGPLILSASGFLGGLEAQSVSLSIDLKPALSEEQLLERMERESAAAGGKALSSFMRGYLPAALTGPVLAQSILDPGRKAQGLRGDERLRLARVLKAFPMKYLSLRGYEEAIVTRGGINVKEVDPRTMESKIIKNLYLAGEMLDLDAATGGYNLQIAWSTGAAAGVAAARREESMKEKRPNRHIAIDGPASSGKSTIAKLIAEETGLIYVDTGAMFRAMAVYFLRQGLNASDEAGISRACEQAQVTIAYEGGSQQVILNGENVTPLLRQEAVGQMASASSVYGPVREKMKALQQQLAAEKDVVMDGRDIGTVILPDAFLKIFLTASVEVRARRRYEELLAKGLESDYETVEREIRERDHRDTTRDIAPLKQAADALLLDSSALSIQAVKEKVLSLYRERLHES